MKKHEFISDYSANTFEFELKSILGSRLDGYSFYGEVDSGSFKIRGNYVWGVRGFSRPVLEGSFCDKNGVTHVAVTPKYSAVDYLGQWIIALLFFAIGVMLLVADWGKGVPIAATVWGLGVVLLVLYHFEFLISARMYIRKFKNMKALKLRQAENN